MIGAILENQKTNKQEYLYLKENNNKLLYYGFYIDNNNVGPIDKNIIKKIYDLFKINDQCIYIEDYLTYQVYLDKKNNIKHYIKDGKEDFLMLFKNNGENLIIYNEKDTTEAKETTSKKFKIKEFIVNVSINFVILMSVYNISIPIINAQLYHGNIYNNFHYKFSEIAYSISNYLDLDIKCIDSNEAIELIRNSKLPNDLKENFSNYNLLNDIFPYYENTKMEYLIKSKLENLKLRIYEPDDLCITDPNTTDGFYDELAPNVLNVKNTNKYKKVAKHEFIHLLQTPENTYIFLKEALAEIISEEYLNVDREVYGYCVSNVSLLMDTIGPRIIWETVFSGNDVNLINILKNNLNKNEYNELISYLQSKPQETVESCQRINQIISNLYKNINKKEIRDDKNIFNEFGYHIKRIYFNEEKMMSEQKDNDFININEIFPNQTIKKSKNKLK